MKIIETRVRQDYTLGAVIVVMTATLVFVMYQIVPNPTPIVAGMVLFALIALAWTYPQTALMCSFALAPFQNDISSGLGPFRFSITEVILLVALVLTAFRIATGHAVVKIGPVIFPALLYFGICISSTLPNWHSSSALPALLQMFLYLIGSVVVFATVVSSPAKFYQGCYLLIAVCVFLSMLEFTTGSGYVLGIHKNGIGSSMAAGVLVCAELWIAATDVRRKIFLSAALAILVGGLIYSLSRGAIAGAAIGLVTILLYRRQIRLLVQVFIVLAPTVLILWNLLPEERREHATEVNMEQHGSLYERMITIQIAARYFHANPIQGFGVTLRKDLDATNLIMITLAETGIIGLGAFLLIHFQVGRMVWKISRIVPRTDPCYSISVIAAALIAAKFSHGLVDHYWSRGSLSIAWAAVGVASGIYLALMNDLRLKARAKLLRPRGARTAS